jgi:hypothetical protein
MRNVIKFNSWEHFGAMPLSKGLLSNRYRNALGWTAQEVYKLGGKEHGTLMHLQVCDEKGKLVGTVPSIAELP